MLLLFPMWVVMGGAPRGRVRELRDLLDVTCFKSAFTCAF